MNRLDINACDGRGKRLLRVDNTLAASLLHVVLGATVIATFVLMSASFMDCVQVNLGLHHYAESLSPLSTPWLPMPLNAIVNFGYVAVGIFWILRVYRLLTNGAISADEAYLMYVFACMAVLYGPVQLIRIITHHRLAGILDQWYTLPIFAWVGVSCQQIGRTSRKLEVCSIGLIMTLSVTSYGLAVLHSRGFEVALGAHICGVVAEAWRVQRLALTEHDRQRQLSAFIRAVVCCTGFVTLKLADWYLVHHFPMLFAVLSGHFWSKIADFLQIHYACQFIEAALVSKLHSRIKSLSSIKYN